MMKENRQENVIFSSSESKDFALAVSLLKAAGYPYRAITRNVRGYQTPQGVYQILVPADHAETAMAQISDVPTETYPEPGPSRETPVDKGIAWVQLALLAFLLIYAIIMAAISYFR